MKMKFTFLLFFTFFTGSFAALKDIFSNFQKWKDYLSEEFEFPFEQYLPDTDDQREDLPSSSFQRKTFPIQDIPGSDLASLDSKRNFGGLTQDLQEKVANYMIDPDVLRRLNKQSRSYVTKTLKYYVDQRFTIPELAEVDDNEQELRGILNLAWCGNDNQLLFSVLLEDLISGKKPYKNLIPPLIKYLVRTFKEFSDEQQQRYRNYIQTQYRCSFEYHLAKFCAKKGRYELVFEVLQDEPREVIKCLAEEVKNREDLMNFFKSNLDFAIEYQRLFLIHDVETGHLLIRVYYEHSSKWLGECLLYKAPDSFYTELLNHETRYIQFFFDSYLITANIPESEYTPIHDKIELLFDRNPELYGPGAHYRYYRVINDICFNPISIRQQRDFALVDLDEWNISTMAKAAIFGDKLEYFSACRQVYSDRYNLDLLEELLRDFSNIENITSKKNFKLLFEIIASEPQTLKTINHLLFVIKFYAVSGVKIQGDRIVFEFVALQNLLDLGFPPRISAGFDKSPETEIGTFLEYVFDFMKVTNEDTFISFLSDYEKLPNYTNSFRVNLETLNMIARSPRLIGILEEKGIKLNVLVYADEYPKLYNIPDLEFSRLIGNIIPQITIDSFSLIKLTNKQHLRLAEKLNWNRTVDMHFLEYEMGHELTEIDYARWRLVFNYWIKGDKWKLWEQVKVTRPPASLETEFKHENWSYPFYNFLTKTQLSYPKIHKYELQFLKWLAYLNFRLRGDKIENIKKIKSPVIIKLLRKEYPTEMREILGPEKKEETG